MTVLRPSEVIARVVAWHNRHPLARRIVPAEVQGVGVVALPFALTAADEGPAASTLVPIFGTDWMYRAAARPLGAWVLRHGRYPLPEAADWPHRQIDAHLPLAHAADARGLDGRTLRHVLTAVIESRGQRVRVLIAPQAPLLHAAVFGSRLVALPRVAVPAAVGAAALGATLLWPGVPETALPAAAVAAQAMPGPIEVSASAVPAASLPASATMPAAHEPPHATASAPAPAVAEKPLDVEPMERLRADGAPPLVQIRPRLTEDEQRAARVQAAELRPAATPASAAASAPAGIVYAIATPPLKTRDDALAQKALLQGLKAQVPTPVPTDLALLAAQGGWRVVWFPHPAQRDAEALVVQARARGLRVELIAF